LYSPHHFSKSSQTLLDIAFVKERERGAYVWCGSTVSKETFSRECKNTGIERLLSDNLFRVAIRSRQSGRESELDPNGNW
jgi:hypothetical protein